MIEPDLHFYSYEWQIRGATANEVPSLTSNPMWLLDNSLGASVPVYMCRPNATSRTQHSHSWHCVFHSWIYLL